MSLCTALCALVSRRGVAQRTNAAHGANLAEATVPLCDAETARIFPPADMRAVPPVREASCAQVANVKSAAVGAEGLDQKRDGAKSSTPSGSLRISSDGLALAVGVSPDGIFEMQAQKPRRHTVASTFEAAQINPFIPTAASKTQLDSPPMLVASAVPSLTTCRDSVGVFPVPCLDAAERCGLPTKDSSGAQVADEECFTGFEELEREHTCSTEADVELGIEDLTPAEFSAEISAESDDWDFELLVETDLQADWCLESEQGDRKTGWQQSCQTATLTRRWEDFEALGHSGLAGSDDLTFTKALELLGLSGESVEDVAQLSSAFRKQSRSCHPDKVGPSEAFNTLVAAYQTAQRVISETRVA